MIFSNEKQIEKFTTLGHWGGDTIHQILATNSCNKPTSLALKDQPNRFELTGDNPISLNWIELEQASENLAIQLQKEGVSVGDKVIIQLPNIVELVISYFALSKIGAIASPIPVQYGKQELQYISKTLGGKVILTIAHFKNIELADQIKNALPTIKVLVFGDDLCLDSTSHQKLEFTPESNANRVLTICWTSGTTGTPKGVPRTHNMWLATAKASAESSKLHVDDNVLCPFPIVNMAALGGILIPALLHGCSLTLHHPLDAKLLLKQIQDDGITFTVAPPALLNQLAKSKDMWNLYDLSSLRRIGSGSAPLSPWMIEIFDTDFSIDVVNMYGSNEGIVLYSTPENTPSSTVRATDFPRPNNGIFFETKVADPLTGKEFTSSGEKGELLVKGATIFEGYFENSEEVFTKDGFFKTGDLVEICGDDGNYYRIVGRCKDIINRGGIKISPVEIDIFLEGFDGAIEAAVCAYPDEILSEKICACLVLSEGNEPPSLSKLQSWLLTKGLSKFKLPERIEIFNQLPRNPIGKVQRFKLAEDVLSRASLTSK
ncbi:class I adenylate-forming enzyme family protein [Thalassotalea profundi]|uniref:AMP-dependent acyl-CoA synthetase n=1 Tax=Thalassotalea profundi TaxID=2036687 RepID=A0ABQ3IQ15_9GAMM|nr:class I adenylate-forming enzyme family protein [Thalassotalea profundi]GHE90911.1 AMP-dependent acyl-CoA synthetase [Thalassotalea profundi]